MNQYRLIVGTIVFVALMIILAISGSAILLNQVKSEPVLIGQRQPVAMLGYCGSNQARPCVLSFNLNPDGGMVINLLTDQSSSRHFYLKIKREETESVYTCRKVTSFSTNFSCTGEMMPLGEPLQFLMVSTQKNILLAEGNFPIIGLAIATPEVAPTRTPIPSLFHRPPK